jgi:hypothetical protein
MTLDEARGHEGETLVHRFLDKDPEQAELVRVGDYALYVRLGSSGDVVTMHPRYFELAASSGTPGLAPDTPLGMFDEPRGGGGA